MRWFGKSWDAMVNEPELKVQAPVGDLCHCLKPIKARQQGVIVTYSADRPHGRIYYDVVFHRLCFERWIKPQGWQKEE